MPSNPDSDLQQRISDDLGVIPVIDAEQEAERRCTFLQRGLAQTGQLTLVLGISGGLDSTVAGRLAQISVQECRSRHIHAHFVALRLPYGQQADAEDAELALKFIAPDEVITMDIKPASDAHLAALETGGLAFADDSHRDFVLSNVKARQRMAAHYAVAGTREGLVIGTGQAAEALMGFFTKFGDGACDIAPLHGLTKRQVRQIGSVLGAPQRLVEKIPTADLETLTPLRPDEEAFGVRYDDIDDFLEGASVKAEVFGVILAAYKASQHKRHPPLIPE